MEPEMVTMEDAAGTAAEEAYTAALESGADPSAAASAAIEAAGAVMTEMGAPADMVDTMSSAAQDGFDAAIDSGMSPMDAFGAAGDSVDAAFGDGPPQAWKVICLPQAWKVISPRFREPHQWMKEICLPQWDR